VDRGGKQFEVSLTPTADPASGTGYIGWSEQVPIQLGEIAPGMPAEKAGLKTGDVLVSADGQPIHSRHKLPEVLQHKAGQPVTLEFLRNGEKKTVSLTAVYHHSNEEGS